MPQIASTGLSPITSSQRSPLSRAIPAGLANPVAVFACNRVFPMPIEADSPVAASTARRSSPASASGSSVRAARNASSQPHTSTTTGNARNVAITCAEAAS